MRSHGGKSGAGRGSGRGMKTRKRVGRRPGCGAENFSAGRGRSAVARKTSRQVGRGSGVSAVREPRLPRGKSVGGAPAFRPQVGRCFCGGRKTSRQVGRGSGVSGYGDHGCRAENLSVGLRHSGRRSDGVSVVARKTSRQVGRGSGVSAVREPRLPRGKSVGGAPAFRPQVGRCFCGGRKTSRQVGRGSGVSGYGDHGCRAENLSVGLRHSGRSANDTAAGRTLFRRHGKYGGNRHRPGCGKPVGGAPALSEAPVAPPFR